MRKIDDATYVVDADGVLVTAAGVGSEETVVIRSDDSALIDRVRDAANANEPVTIVYQAKPFIAGWDTEIGVLAALMAAAPGRTYIKEAPETAMKEIWALTGDDEPGVIY